MIENLAKWSAKYSWIVVAIWVVVFLIGGFLIFKFLPDALTTEQSFRNNPESKEALSLMSERFESDETTNEIVVVKSSKYKVTDPEFKTFVLDLQKNLLETGKERVESVVSYYQAPDSSLVSKDSTATILLVSLNGDLVEAEKNIEEVKEVVEQADEQDDFSVFNSGLASINKDFQKIAEEDLQKGEFFGIPVALIILIVVFGTVTAAVIPIVLSFLAIALAIASVAVIGQEFQLSFFVTNMITMMGLAVGIDYSLFIISRFREERAKGLEKLSAIEQTGRTASRAVFFSGITVILALMGLLIVPMNIFQSLAIGAILVVIAAVFVATTLLPAILSILGDKINFLRAPFIGTNLSGADTEKGFWHFVAQTVMRRPLISLILSAGTLLILAAPLLSMHIGSSGVDSLPNSLESRKGFEILKEEFSSGLLAPALIVIDGQVDSSPVNKEIETLQEKIGKDSVFGVPVLRVTEEKDLAVLSVPINLASQDAQKVVKKLRTEYIPESFDQTKVYVGGSVAENLDFVNMVYQYIPIVFAFVLGLSFVLLLVVFRSIIIPVKAIIMNLLSVGAAYGLLVLVFQEGVGASFFGFQQVDVIEAWIPLFLFAILFGLSMDYHVFLLSRIKEKFDQTGDNRFSVAFGLASTGRIITGAALIMVAVFSAFAAGQLVMFQQVGFGLAIAVFLDATIVRSILVPAAMELLGDANWYLPKWLGWLPKIGIEGSSQKKS